MTSWTLSQLLADLHEEIEKSLAISRRALKHPVSKGDASEEVWLELFNNYLPQRYQASKAQVVDCQGNVSDQIDIVIFDRQYTPFIFNFKGQTIIPAESVYAVFEAKQTINSSNVEYARQKIESVRQLHRTSLPIPHAGGTYPAKPLLYIYGGLLAFESDWKPPLGDSLLRSLEAGTVDNRIDMGCIAAHGMFHFNRETDGLELIQGGKPATAFLFQLISALQLSGTVPMIDIQAYARWLL